MSSEAGGLQLVALVPMRHSSARVPEKNFRPLAGRPLYEYILRTLHAVPEIDAIAVDSDSPVILRGVAEAFPRVRLIERPAHLRGEEVPMNEVLRFDVTQIDAPHYLQTHSTNPLLKAETISRAIAAYFAALPQHDSLFSVTPLHTRLWGADGQPLNHDPQELIRTQDLPPVYEENSCLYIFSREQLLQRRNRLGSRPLLFPLEMPEAWDIDEPLDFEIVGHLIRRDE
jgi:CMP-N-acetylneuraminic acid synthetase